MAKYKPAKTLNEQVEYLRENKRVVYNKMKEDEAKGVLLKYNYINIISPYKHKFARIDNKHEVIKVNNRHVYDYDVEFDDYYSLFMNERKLYPLIINNLLEFEINFKSITSYYILTTYKIVDSAELETFLNTLRLRLSFLNNKYNEERIKHMNEHFDKLISDIDKYADVYCYFDRMNLGDMLTIFITIDNNQQDNILADLSEIEMNFNVQKVSDFIDKVFTAVSIRNCVMHSNSLEILTRFYNPKTRTLRKVSNRKKFNKVINYLSKEKTY